MSLSYLTQLLHGCHLVTLDIHLIYLKKHSKITTYISHAYLPDRLLFRSKKVEIALKYTTIKLLKIIMEQNYAKENCSIIMLFSILQCTVSKIRHLQSFINMQTIINRRIKWKSDRPSRLQKSF